MNNYSRTKLDHGDDNDICIVIYTFIFKGCILEGETLFINYMTPLVFFFTMKMLKLPIEVYNRNFQLQIIMLLLLGLPSEIKPGTTAAASHTQETEEMMETNHESSLPLIKPHNYTAAAITKFSIPAHVKICGARNLRNCSEEYKIALSIVGNIPDCTKIIAVSTARCPIIRFSHEETGLHCDVSINNRYVHMYVSMYVCTYICTYVCLYVCLFYVFTCNCLYTSVCMYVCLYLLLYIYYNIAIIHIIIFYIIYIIYIYIYIYYIYIILLYILPFIDLLLTIQDC